MHTSLSLHFTDVQCLDMFRALLTHHQEALHERGIDGYCVLKLISSWCTICIEYVEVCIKLVVLLRNYVTVMQVNKTLNSLVNETCEAGSSVSQSYNSVA
jgi:hypothetical protein